MAAELRRTTVPTKKTRRTVNCLFTLLYVHRQSVAGKTGQGRRCLRQASRSLTDTELLFPQDERSAQRVCNESTANQRLLTLLTGSCVCKCRRFDPGRATVNAHPTTLGLDIKQKRKLTVHVCDTKSGEGTVNTHGSQPDNPGSEGDYRPQSEDSGGE